jgi:hypothetical protein
MSPVRYELGFYIPENGILHNDSTGNLKSYSVLIESMKLSTLYTANMANSLFPA